VTAVINLIVSFSQQHIFNKKLSAVDLKRTLYDMTHTHVQPDLLIFIEFRVVTITMCTANSW